MVQRVKDFRPWYNRGKVICLCHKCCGHNFYHPIRPYRSGNYWDESLIRQFMKDGKVVVIVDYGFKFEVPSSYNDVPSVGCQLNLF